MSSWVQPEPAAVTEFELKPIPNAASLADDSVPVDPLEAAEALPVPWTALSQVAAVSPAISQTDAPVKVAVPPVVVAVTVLAPAVGVRNAINLKLRSNEDGALVVRTIPRPQSVAVSPLSLVTVTPVAAGSQYTMTAMIEPEAIPAVKDTLRALVVLKPSLNCGYEIATGKPAASPVRVNDPGDAVRLWLPEGVVPIATVDALQKSPLPPPPTLSARALITEPEPVKYCA